MIHRDIKTIEPLLDDWIKQAEMRGRLGGILEMVDARRQDEEPDVVSHFHPCVVCSEPVECTCPFADHMPENWYCQADFPF
jgi:hypothetical protein